MLELAAYCIGSFIMRERPACALQQLTQAATCNDRIVISAITYAQMRYGQRVKQHHLITKNTREFSRGPGLVYEDWVH
ncbi:MAG: hypothetical protein WA878_16990 [Pseudomonas sp.]